MLKFWNEYEKSFDLMTERTFEEAYKSADRLDGGKNNVP